jgi:OPT family oligopeptide transporter
MIPQLNHHVVPSVLITGIVAQLTALPLGHALSWILPTTRFRTLGHTWSLNPGPFNIKEHTVVTAMANVVYLGAYATDIVATQRVFYKQTLPYSYQILLVLGTQLLGFAFGGHLRALVVWPASALWPGALVNAALFNTLHKNFGTREAGNHLTRERFFVIVLVAGAAWYWVPGYLFTALSVANWVCWIRPGDTVVNSLFGSVTGLGMGVITLDWAVVAYIGSPLVTPVRFLHTSALIAHD